MTTLRISRVDGVTYSISGADRLLAEFFEYSRSAREGKFDDRANEPVMWNASPDSYSRADIHAMNSAMGTHFSPKHAQDLLIDHDLPWLAALGERPDLILCSTEAWRRLEPLAAEAIKALWGLHRNRAVVTKLLHLKRPGLFPIIDKFVAWALASPLPGSPEDVMRLLIRIREIGRENLKELRSLRSDLCPSHGRYQRSFVRLLEVALWKVGQQDGPYNHLTEWLTRPQESEGPATS